MDENFKKPPTNRAQAWFRVFLWLVPAGFAFTSAVGLVWLSIRAFPVDDLILIGVWLLLNLMFVIGAGWFDSQLSAKVRSESDKVSDEVMSFFMLQLFLVPVLSIAMAVILGIL